MPDMLFNYEPLDQSQASIRLVKVLSSQSSDGLLQCQLEHSSVDASYTCLSYRWGNPSPEQHILINGERLKIRRNLFDFLTMLRNDLEAKGKVQSQFYWIDALCIDQANISERNHQVRHMGSIYSRAKCVNVWLGKSSPMARIFRAFENRWASGVLDRASVYWGSGIIKREIMYNPYWTRAWVTQEIALGQRVLVFIGQESMLLSDLTSAFYKFDLSRDLVGSPMEQFDALNFQDYDRSTTLIALLDRYREKKCAIPRDRIYSLFSICGKGGQHIPVDYAQDSRDMAYELLSSCTEWLCFCSIRLVLQSIARGDDELEKWIFTEGYSAVGPYVEMETRDMRSTFGPWKVLDTPQSSRNGDSEECLAYREMERFYFRQPRGIQRLKECDSFLPVMKLLAQQSAVVVGNTIPEKLRVKSIGGERIPIPKSVRSSALDTEIIPSERRSTMDDYILQNPDDVQMHVNGYHLASLVGKASSLRISLDVFWKSLKDDTYAIRLCDRARLGQNYSMETEYFQHLRIGEGPWNRGPSRKGKERA